MAEGDIFRATVMGITKDNAAINFDFGYADKAVGSTRLDTGIAAGNFQTLVQTTMVAALDDNTSLYKYRFACTDGPNKGDIGYVEVSPVQGTVVPAIYFPNEMCISLKRNTGRTGRDHRGRIFFGPANEDTVLAADTNQADQASATLLAVRDLLKATLTVSGRTLTPVLLKSNGTTNGYTIINVGIAAVLCHRKSRRPRFPN